MRYAIAPLLALFAPAALAMSLALKYETPGSVIMPVVAENIIRRSESGASFPVPFFDGSTPAPSARLYFIPDSATGAGGMATADINVRFRLADVPLSCQALTSPQPNSIVASGAPAGSNRPEITDWKLGTGDGDYVEFLLAMPAYVLHTWGSTNYIDFTGSWPTFSCIWRTRLDMVFLNPYAIEDYEPPGAMPSAIDHWYRLSHYKWPDDILDGAPMPPYLSIQATPLAGESVTITGTDVIFKPESTTTDSDGLFGVVAFVAVDAFEKSASKAAPAKTGSLQLHYRDLMRQKGISGNFAEVIQVEGRVTIVGSSGSGTVSVGDVLAPGTMLSLAASVGEKPAQLGLRFVNGSDAQVSQDVYTNACITDLIVIGSSGFTDRSVIQGKSALMSMTRYLCEQVAGLPNTPEEWAKATGKFVVKQAVSALVPVSMGYETTAFVVKYAVQTATGKAYDYTLSSPGNNGSKAGAKVTGGDRRVEVATYYDGSTRIAENLDGGLALYAGAAAAPFASTQDGVWQELAGGAAAGRAWNETPDSLDTEGPSLRVSYEYVPFPGSTVFRITASDASGVDPASLSVFAEGIAGDLASYFHYDGDGLWSGNLLGLSPQGVHLQVSLSDRLGHATSFAWRADLLPGMPTQLTALNASGRTWAGWAPPDGMAASDVVLYELRHLRDTGSGYDAGSWQAVGRATHAFVDLPASIVAGNAYAVEVRAWNAAGLAGPAARSLSVTAGEETSPASNANLSVSHAAGGATAFTAKDVAYTVTVTNAGPATATDVVLTDILPAGTPVVWSHPGCTRLAGVVTCPLGSLAPGASAMRRFVVRPAAIGPIANAASVAGGGPEASLSDNASLANHAVNAPAAGAAAQRYRLFSPVTKEHHFTTDLNEYTVLGTYVGTWIQEGTVGHVLDNPGAFGGVTATPYYRLYNTSNAQHHWTTDPNEYYTLILFPQYNGEGVDGWILPIQAAGTIPLYRLLYPYSIPVAGLHHWTIDPVEYSQLISVYGWVGEGGSGYVIP